MAAAPVIDAHHHFWQVRRGDYHWMAPEMGEPLYRDYMPDDLAPLLRKAGIDATVVVQAAQTEAETAFLFDLAAQTPFVAGVVGWLDMEDDSFGAKLDRLERHSKFVGLRPMLQDLADDAYILRPAVLANLEMLAERGIALDILVHPRHLPHVVRALEAVPGMKAVIDHIAKPDIASGAVDGWARDMASVASFTNVHCKLSGMITEADHRLWKPQDLQPYVDHVVGLFGSDRLMFGSDWPVCLQAGSYAEALQALRAILDGRLTEAARDAVYGLNAARFYGLCV